MCNIDFHDDANEREFAPLASRSQQQHTPKMIREKLLNIQELSAEINLPVRTIRTLLQKRRVPCIKLGHRTMRFNPAKVMAALDRFEVREFGRN